MSPSSPRSADAQHASATVSTSPNHITDGSSGTELDWDLEAPKADSPETVSSRCGCAKVIYDVGTIVDAETVYGTEGLVAAEDVIIDVPVNRRNQFKRMKSGSPRSLPNPNRGSEASSSNDPAKYVVQSSPSSPASPAPPPPPPAPPPPSQSEWSRLPWPCGDGEESLFVCCLQCNRMCLIRFNDNPFRVCQRANYPSWSSMILTTCRRCLKAKRIANEGTLAISQRCEEAFNMLQLSARFIRGSPMYKIACKLAGRPVTVHETSNGSVAYESVFDLSDEMDADCILMGVDFPRRTPRTSPTSLVYLPGGFF